MKQAKRSQLAVALTARATHAIAALQTLAITLRNANHPTNAETHPALTNNSNLSTDTGLSHKFQPHTEESGKHGHIKGNKQGVPRTRTSARLLKISKW
jgi:hypothetical protein